MSQASCTSPFLHQPVPRGCADHPHTRHMQISRLTALLEASKLHAALSNEQVRHWQWLSCRRCPSASQSFPVLALSLALLTVTPAHASGRLSIVGAACMWGLWALRGMGGGLWALRGGGGGGCGHCAAWGGGCGHCAAWGGGLWALRGMGGGVVGTARHVRVVGTARHGGVVGTARQGGGVGTARHGGGGLWALPCSVLPPVGDIVAVLPALLLTLLCRAVLSSSWQTCCRVKEI